jgi:hypothetical protein
MRLALSPLLVVAAAFVARAAPGPFSTSGNKVFDADGNWVVFKGVGLSCTEYFARPNMPVPAATEQQAAGQAAEQTAPAAAAATGGARGARRHRLESWPGAYGFNACFGGASAPNATLALNDEVANVARYLTGANFAASPSVRKVAWPKPYDEVVSAGSPRAVPIVRIPVASATYMFDAEANGLGAAGYRAVLDLLVTNLTAQGIAVIIDQHEDCAGGGKLNCSSRGGPMALRDWGSELNGPVRFWSLVAQTYASNHLVFYELYNEPHTWFQALYGGDPLYVGMSEMYKAVRNHTATGLVIMAGNGYAQDAASLIAASMEFERESGAPLSNVLFNLHPYQGAYQGVWISLRSTLRLTLALQQIGPVIYTELGQYCCNAGPAKTCQTSGMCNDHAHGDHFVLNLLNLAAQVDVSWIGWAWRGTNANGGSCAQGQSECNYPDMRDVGAVLTNGSSGGANWAAAWRAYVAADPIIVRDDGDPAKVNVTDYEVEGFLPKPCIIPAFGMGDACGWPLGVNISKLPWTSLWNQSVRDSVLPGLPPSGPPSACLQQACEDYACSPYSSVVPMPEPCAPGAR